MGKYMRKAKITGEVAVMEVSHQSPLGVRTRARTLALQRLQNPSTPASSYLQLRSRRLEKPPAKPCKDNPNPSSPNSTPAPLNSSSVKDAAGAGFAAASEAETDGGIEVSFGENVLEIENRDRNARETTPCSLMKDSEAIRTPGSTTRPANSTASNRRPQNSMPRNIPTAHEMEEFFAVAEQLQQRIFVEKYNFDPVNDRPLPGRYEWVKLDS